MSQALYRKYRSKKLSEIVGQEHITRTLENALKTGKISHAYLFTGPRGTGKTSIARILAHELNDLAYTDESMHLDIIEIDAASNRRIDEIRDLRDKVHIAPTSAKYKVYIIDEVHMLTREAFNALLKTLEEPPAHVVFILATTEVHKLPETIISRTQRFTFKLIDEAKVVEHLKTIAKAEKMEIDEEALRLFALHGRGSFRDSISLLDQVGNSGGKISRTDAEKLVGFAANEHISRLLDATLHGQAADIISALDQLIADGIGPAQAAKQLSASIRKQIIEGDTSARLTDLLADLLNVPASPEPAGELEVALFRAQLAGRPQPASKTQLAAAAPVAPQLEAKPEELMTSQPATDAAKPTPKPESTLQEESPIHTTPAETPESPAPPAVIGEIAEWWTDVLGHIKSVNNTLYGVLRMAEPKVEGETLHLSFGFGFHKKKADDAATQAKIHQAIEKVTGRPYQINTVHDKNLTQKAQTETLKPLISEPSPEPAGDDISSVTNIFGGGEVLES